eukprot:6332306-Prymnesium_polylepis.1
MAWVDTCPRRQIHDSRRPPEIVSGNRGLESSVSWGWMGSTADDECVCVRQPMTSVSAISPHTPGATRRSRG